MVPDNKFVLCTWDDEEKCADCPIQDKLNCRFDKELLGCFRRRHIPFRLWALSFVAYASWMTGIYIMFVLFAVLTLLNFTVFETYYLCRHCPFYDTDDRTLQCITLKGMPRVWKTQLTPLTRSDKNQMMVIGGLIDLFPLAAGAITLYILWMTGADLELVLLVLILTIMTLIAAGYFGKYLETHYCARCVNLSCMMSKVPEEIKQQYLKRNPEMLELWKFHGYEEKTSGKTDADSE